MAQAAMPVFFFGSVRWIVVTRQPIPVFLFTVCLIGSSVPKKQEDTSGGMAAHTHFLLQGRLDGQVRTQQMAWAAMPNFSSELV